MRWLLLEHHPAAQNLERLAHQWIGLGTRQFLANIRLDAIGGKPLVAQGLRHMAVAQDYPGAVALIPEYGLRFAQVGEIALRIVDGFRRH